VKECLRGGYIAKREKGNRSDHHVLRSELQHALRRPRNWAMARVSFDAVLRTVQSRIGRISRRSLAEVLSQDASQSEAGVTEFGINTLASMEK
jgi:hypothetical protein